MADISDVENTLVGLVASFLQIGPPYLPGSAVSSPVVQAQCRIYRGWPLASALDKDLAAGIANVSVFPVAGAGRRATRYVPEWHAQPAVPPTLTAEISGSNITIGGTSGTNQVVGVRFGFSPNPDTYTYRPASSDSPLTIASALGGMIPNSTVTGPVLTVPSADNVEAVVAVDQSMWMETRRQEQHVWVIGWCPTPQIRDVLMSAVDEGFGNMTNASGNLTDQFPLPDGSSARLLYMNSHTDDQPQKANLWRRDLRYVVNYPTTITQQFPTMVFGRLVLNGTVDESVGPPID